MQEVKTRSQYMIDDDPLREVFGRVEDDSKDFIDSIQDLFGDNSGQETISNLRKLEKGQPDIVKAPKPLTQEVSKFIRIIHGWHRSDYVWHIEHAAIRRPWRVREDEVLYRIARIMDQCLPDIEIKIWLPRDDWELRTFTFKAMGLQNHWSFEESAIPDINNRLFEHLNTIV